MKTQITTIILLFQAIFCNSQSLVTTNKSWNNLEMDMYYYNLSTEIIKFTSDTVINGLTYKLVERSIDEAQLNWVLYGFIREDSTKKVYYKLNISEPERLFYDFNLNLDDTITAYSLVTKNSYFYILPQLFHVLSVDSILIGDTYRKQINLSIPRNPFSAYEHWIDSTGNTGGILHNYFDGSVGEEEEIYLLLCFTEDGIVKYHNSYYDTCYVIEGYNEINDYPETLSVNVYPNPLSKFSMLTVECKGTDQDVNIDFFDLLGRKILSSCFRKVISLDLSTFNTGAYYYKVHTKAWETSSGKLLIM